MISFCPKFDHRRCDSRIWIARQEPGNEGDRPAAFDARVRFFSYSFPLDLFQYVFLTSLLSLTFSSLSFSFFSADIDVIVNQIVFEEPLISESKKPHLRRLIYSKYPSSYIVFDMTNSWVLQWLLYSCLNLLLVLFLSYSTELIEKLESNESSDFFLFKILRAHILPLTNCAFNKSGDKFITGRSVGRSVNMVLFRPPFYSWILVLSTVDTHTHTSYDSHTHQRLSCSPFLIPCTLLSW